MASGVLVIVVVAALLAGVVALNVAVLRLNLRLDDLGQKRAKLRAENAALASQLASSAAAGRIQQAGGRASSASTPASPEQTTLRRLRAGNARAAPVGPPHPSSARAPARRFRPSRSSRAVWLQTVRAQGLASARRASSTRRSRLPPGEERSSTAWASSSRSARRRRPSTPTRGRCTNARAVAVAAAKTLDVDADALYPQLLDKSKGFVYVMRKADPEHAKALERKHLCRARLHPGGAPRVPAGWRGRAGARLRGHRQPRPRRPRAAARPRISLDGPGSETFVKDPFGRVLNVVESVPGAAGQGRLPHDRPHDPGQRRVGSAVDRFAVGRQPGDGGRARRADRRHPRDGGRAGLRREPLSERTGRPASQRRRYGHLRAGVDVQARDRRGGALGGSRQRQRHRSRCPTASTSPTGSSTMQSRAERRR